MFPSPDPVVRLRAGRRGLGAEAVPPRAAGPCADEPPHAQVRGDLCVVQPSEADRGHEVAARRAARVQQVNPLY